jgi:hypothetical protein
MDIEPPSHTATAGVSYSRPILFATEDADEQCGARRRRCSFVTFFSPGI